MEKLKSLCTYYWRVWCSEEVPSISEHWSPGGESYTSGVIAEVFKASPSFQFSDSCRWLRMGSLSILLLPPAARPPCHNELLALQNWKPKKLSFFSKTFLVRMLYHSNRTVTNTGWHNFFPIVKNSLTQSNQRGKGFLFYFGLQHVFATFCCCGRHHDPATQTQKGLLGLQFQRELRQPAWCQENSFWSTGTKQKEKTWRRQSLKPQRPPVIHSLNKAAPAKCPQTAAPPGDQMFKYLQLWGIFSVLPPHRGNVNWCNHYGNSMVVLQIQNYHMIQQFHVWI